jgi:site-specific DNA-methyltransferase (adenine-specific)
MWIDGGRIPLLNNEPDARTSKEDWQKGASKNPFSSGESDYKNTTYKSEGRWPANVILDETSAEMLDEQTGIQKGGFVRNRTDGARPFENDGKDTGYETVAEISEPDGGASRFFYCAKASRKERNMGLEELPDKEVVYSEYRENYKDTKDFVTHYPDGTPRPVNPTKNTHATVKPLALMEYLCKLTRTPTGGIVLDPFMGSGTTGMACVNTDRDFIGIELIEEHYIIARKRIEHAQAILKGD